MSRVRTPLLIIASLACAGGTLAQAGPASQPAVPPAVAVQPATAATPLAGAQRTLLALKQNRLEDFGAMMHPEALDQFRGMLLQVVDGAAREGKQAEVLKLFSGVGDVEALKKLSPAEFYVAFLRGVMNQQPDLQKAMSGANYRFLGHVMEGPTAHVVYRLSMRFGTQDIALPGVISLKKNGTGWTALLTGDIEGMAQALTQRFSGQAKDMDLLESAKAAPSVLGEVKEGKDTIHVVVRWVTTLGAARVSKLSAHTFQPKDAGWTLLVKKDRAGLTRLLAKNFGPL